jgi:hypothetical protein
LTHLSTLKDSDGSRVPADEGRIALKAIQQTKASLLKLKAVLEDRSPRSQLMREKLGSKPAIKRQTVRAGRRYGRALCRAHLTERVTS